MGLMLMADSASNQMETESEFLTHDSLVKIKPLAESVVGQGKLSMARAAWLKVTCRTRDSVRRLLLYLTHFCHTLIQHAIEGLLDNTDKQCNDAIAIHVQVQQMKHV
jgi:hypothetical protein